MVFQQLKSGLPVSDETFDRLYSASVQKIAAFYFTPVEVAKAAAAFLVTAPGKKVLDIGSGAGKFCMVGASCTEGAFTGIEQRQQLHLVASELTAKHQIQNVQFLHSNIIDIRFDQFDAVYFYNAFYENIWSDFMIDQTTETHRDLYFSYSKFVREQLDSMPPGTRLVTYFSFLEEVPASYSLQQSLFDDKLKMWVKEA
ncbi:MAG: methyltransferase domain-containing protein [Lewinellaceae bacterium]|nr:methyltransferase domain-containing protein [Lewinellaceae bacterium]